MKGFTTTSAIIEVETPSAIADDPDHILDQLDDFRIQGYKHLLVVPNSIIDEATEFIDEAVEGPIEVTSPSSVAEYF